ncbi:probable 4-coumarate--CoA ligase 1 [Halyomorpha halys]|uniref:probable 4-coumarate--CoA ligase 1 n=1 Tax=Halyomorpha halys TaxID=286706 RepID=UPI0006D50B19|nr:4-coumarate--CoA ligase 1 [Halyomorpha halys]
MEEYTNVADYVLGRISSKKDNVAQIDSTNDKTISFADIHRMVNTVSRKVQSAGFGQGSVVALCYENSLEYVGVLLGILKAGAIAALYPTSLRSRELEHAISITKPSVLYAPQLNSEQLGIIKTFSNIKIFKWSLEEMLEDKDYGKVQIQHSMNESQPAVLLSSSGSTGLPKAVIISHSNLIWSLRKTSALLMKADEPALGLMPFSHAYGLGLMLMALCEGSPLVVMSKFTPEKFSEVLVTHKIKLLHVVASFLPKMINGSINSDSLSSISAVYTGAAPILPKVQAAVLERLEPGAKMYHSYGMTETTHIVCFGEVRSDKPGSPGPLLSCMNAKVIGENGEDLEPGKRGELCLKGPLIMSGYYGNTEATEETFTNDKWLKTGDLAWIDSDGYVYLVDRIKDIIKFLGYQISVTELEQVISEQPGVSEVAVVGIPHEAYGEVPRAYIVPNEMEKPTRQEIEEAIKRELSHYKWLRGGVSFVKSLPKTHSMKIIRKHLQALP